MHGFATSNYGAAVYPVIEDDGEGNIILPYRLYNYYSEIGNFDFQTITNDTSQSNPIKWLYLKYALSDEIQPSGSEAYTLTLENGHIDDVECSYPGTWCSFPFV